MKHSNNKFKYQISLLHFTAKTWVSTFPASSTSNTIIRIHLKIFTLISSVESKYDFEVES